MEARAGKFGAKRRGPAKPSLDDMGPGTDREIPLGAEGFRADWVAGDEPLARERLPLETSPWTFSAFAAGILTVPKGSSTWSPPTT